MESNGKNLYLHIGWTKTATSTIQRELADSVNKIIEILPGMKSPTVLPLAKEGWSSVHTVIREDDFWQIIEDLRKAGAEGILVVPIEKMIV